MTKDAKSIIKKDIKKYESLAKFAGEENRKEYAEIAVFMKKIIKK